MAFTVAAAFERFCKNLRFSDDNLSKISNRYHSITKRINIDYWGTSSDSSHSLYVGSYGRDTEIFRRIEKQRLVSWRGILPFRFTSLCLSL